MEPDPRDAGRGVTIRYAVGQCRLGAVLVAASERGICAVFLAEEGGGTPLVRMLAARFPQATLVPGGDAIAADLARIIAFVDAPDAALDVPLDARGTPFQRRVWQALQAVPAGTTISYAALAQAIGRPRAVRAAAAACAANPLAVLVPCHRAVRGDGTLAGYRWGIGLKQRLLARERREAAAGHPAAVAAASEVGTAEPLRA